VRNKYINLKHSDLRLSIITINFNNASGLERTIKSVISQTFSDYEWILIDGASKDGSLKIIQQYSDNFSYWVSESDTGVYNAQNKGILKARGKYCFFLNSGDYLVNNLVLEHIFKDDNSCDVIYGNLLVATNNKLVVKISGVKDLTFLDVYSSSVKHQASFIKRTLFEKYGLYDESLKIAADWAFFIKTIGLGGASSCYIDIDIAYFDNNGLSNKNPEICRQEEQIILDHFIPGMMKEDYKLLKKYKGIRTIEQLSLSWYLFRILVKTTKMLMRDNNVL
jgi:glycosyltransferase involved in cell wall biosynthesis